MNASFVETLVCEDKCMSMKKIISPECIRKIDALLPCMTLSLKDERSPTKERLMTRSITCRNWVVSYA